MTPTSSHISPGRAYHAAYSLPDVGREERLSQVALRLDEQQVRSRGLDGGALAAYRSYAGTLTADIDAVTGLGPPATPSASRTLNVVPAPEERGDGQSDPNPPATLPPTGSQDNYLLIEPPDANTTPRYAPREGYREKALRAVESECSAAFHARGPQAQEAIVIMVARVLQIQEDEAACGTDLQIAGATPLKMLCREFVANPEVTDAMILKMGNVELKDMARTPEERKDIEERMPGSRRLITHKMAVALLSAITGIPPEILSQQCPDLGLSGTPDDGLWEPGTGYPEQLLGDKADFQLGNVLHDTTDFLKDAGVGGLNQAVWGDESSTISAGISVAEAYGGGRYD